MQKILLPFVAVLSFGPFIWAQPSNDDCNNAARLCFGQPLQGTTTAATSSGAEEDNFCSFYSATVWYIFTTNSLGGTVTIDLSGMAFNPGAAYGQTIDAVIIEAASPCSGTYVPRSNCENSGVDISFSSVVPLAPSTTYFLLINGSQFGGGATLSAECDFQIEISGPAMNVTPPTASISAIDTILCEGDDEAVEVIISNCSDTASFDWYYDNVLISSSANNTFNTNILGGPGYLKLIINCGSYCVYSDTTDSIYFDVTPISAFAGPDKFIQEGEVVTLDGSGDGSPLWSPSTTLTNSTIFAPTANPINTTTYFLTVTNGSCVKTDSMNVFVGEVITIYSGFSPNGDNINDKWIIKNSAQYPDMEITVYDRSGQRVFNTTGYSTPDKWWDGTYKGKQLPVSTYFYVIDLKIGEDGIFKGQINIIR